MLRSATLLLAGLLLSGCGAAAPPDEQQAGTSPGQSRGSPGTGSSSPDAGAAAPGPGAESLAAAAERAARGQDAPREQGSERGDGGQDPSVPPREGPVTGGDVSYPNCPRGIGIPQRKTLGLPMPRDDAEFVVVGLTNGPGYFANPCLADQVGWAKRHDMMVAAYHVVSFPDARQRREYGTEGPHDAGTRRGRLRNAGHSQAVRGMEWMQRTGLESPVVWLDIEPVPDWEWTDDTRANVAVIQGAVRAYEQAGYRVGFYSVPSLWDDIVGGWGPGLPEWRSAGDTSRAEALSRCRGSRHSLQGGQAVLAQWWDEARDYDVTCPGVAQHLGRWFHQY